MRVHLPVIHANAFGTPHISITRAKGAKEMDVARIELAAFSNCKSREDAKQTRLGTDVSDTDMSNRN